MSPPSRDSSVRTFRCRRCGEVAETATRTGALPSVCDRCDPGAAARRVTGRGGESAYARRAREVLELRGEVQTLRAQLADVAITVPDPGKASLGRAVRRVAYAEGAEATRDALLTLAAEARAWAALLVAGPVTPDDVATGEPGEIFDALGAGRAAA